MVHIDKFAEWTCFDFNFNSTLLLHNAAAWASARGWQPLALGPHVMMRRTFPNKFSILPSLSLGTLALLARIAIILYTTLCGLRDGRGAPASSHRFSLFECFSVASHSHQTQMVTPCRFCPMDKRQLDQSMMGPESHPLHLNST